MAGLRRIDRVTHVDYAGSTVNLVETIWSWRMGRHREKGWFRYQTPTSISIDGMPATRIHDHLMLARLGFLALTITLLIRSLVFRPSNSQMRRETR